MQNATLSGNVTPATPNNYSPSVPISLYREVAAELQAAQAMLEALKAHNQQLVQQNQQLRREIDTVVNSSFQLQQAITSAKAVSQIGMPQMPAVKMNFTVLEPPRLSSASPSSTGASSELTAPNSAVSPFPLPEPEPSISVAPETLFTEEPAERPYRLRTHPKKASDLSGLWLAVAIFVIVIAAFGAGYWIVRPLLHKN